jgi:formylglycine-generating enzyme
VSNPTGPAKSFDPDEPYAPKHVIRGGSFLCTEAFCFSYRPAARMKVSPDTGLPNVGFRLVMSREMVEPGKQP